ncbi:MAG: STAS domain-containing protein [Actinomycetota bacterium]|nr:STAS domain-containing protein [Actinomycetota bacterium]
MTERAPRYEGEGLRLRATAHNGTASLALEGELDMASAPTLESALADALASADAVELDLGGVRFMDSSGLRALLCARRDADAAGRRLRLVDVSPAVSRILEVTRTASLFDAQPPDG